MIFVLNRSYKSLLPKNYGPYIRRVCCSGHGERKLNGSLEIPRIRNYIHYKISYNGLTDTALTLKNARNRLKNMKKRFSQSAA